jgi:hypothetical protein
MPNNSESGGTPIPYRGPPVGCGWCAYETDGTGPAIPAALASVVVETPSGTRQVCERHAMRGHWRARGRRVGAVA